jgi:hypothetical protein
MTPDGRQADNAVVVISPLLDTFRSRPAMVFALLLALTVAAVIQAAGADDALENPGPPIVGEVVKDEGEYGTEGRTRYNVYGIGPAPMMAAATTTTSPTTTPTSLPTTGPVVIIKPAGSAKAGEGNIAMSWEAGPLRFDFQGVTTLSINPYVLTVTGPAHGHSRSTARR